MQDEVLNNVSGEVDNTDYITAIKELKEKSVSRDEYLKLKQENRQLLDSLVNGKEIEVETKKPEISTEELRDQLFHRELTNLDYCSKALELRDRIISEGGKDPFLPNGHTYVVQQSDIDTANKVATVMKECVEYADGDAEIFTNELMRRTVDVKIPRR